MITKAWIVYIYDPGFIILRWMDWKKFQKSTINS